MQEAKHKKMTYLLICAVAVIWGIVIYRLFFSEAGDEDQVFLQPKAIHEPYDQYVSSNDSFKLALNYRDPFLGKMSLPADTPKVKQEHRLPVAIKPPEPPVNWGLIRYSGYVINPATKKIVAILTVNERERMVAEGESFEGVKLIKNRKDSILVSWLGKQKYIRP